MSAEGESPRADALQFVVESDRPLQSACDSWQVARDVAREIECELFRLQVEWMDDMEQTKNALLELTASRAALAEALRELLNVPGDLEYHNDASQACELCKAVVAARAVLAEHGGEK